MRRSICQHRHGSSHACSTTMMDDTLTILSLGPMKMVTKLSRKSSRALEKSGHHYVHGWKQEVSGVVHCARLGVKCQQITGTKRRERHSKRVRKKEIEKEGKEERRK